MNDKKFDKNYYYGEIYEDYDTFMDFEKLARGLIRRYSFDSFLDIGCGCGNLAKELKKQIENSNRKCLIQGVDFSEFAVKTANCSFVCESDCRQLKFDDSSFDVVYILGTFGYLPTIDDVLIAMREAYRVCKKQIVFEDVYDNPLKTSDDYDPYRVQFLNQIEWRDLWTKILRDDDSIKITKDEREEIVITKGCNTGKP
ncbi:MAG: class I SAM-dependent methyltransferase [Nitrospirae bacterium]|nr:class I SAM-dependent methyltransferase [Nitrospirota bacterium]